MADGGRYVTVLALVSIVAGLTDVGLTSIGVRELSVREGDERHRLVRSIIGLRIALTSAGVLGAVAFAAAAGYDSTLVVGTLLAGIGLIVQNLQSTLGIALMVRMRLGWVTVLELIRQVVFVGLVVSFVVAGASLLPFLAIPIPAAVVALVLTGLLVRRDIPVSPSFERAEWGVLMRDILPYAAATAVASIYFRLAIVLLSLISTATQTGYFGAAFRVVEVLVVDSPAAGDGRLSDLLPCRARRPRPPRLRGAAHVGGVHPAGRTRGGVAGARGDVRDRRRGRSRFRPRGGGAAHPGGHRPGRVRARAVVVCTAVASSSRRGPGHHPHHAGGQRHPGVGARLVPRRARRRGGNAGGRCGRARGHRRLPGAHEHAAPTARRRAAHGAGPRAGRRGVVRARAAVRSGDGAGSAVYIVVLLVLRAVPEEVFVELRRLRGSPAT